MICSSKVCRKVVGRRCRMGMWSMVEGGLWHISYSLQEYAPEETNRHTWERTLAQELDQWNSFGMLGSCRGLAKSFGRKHFGSGVCSIGVDCR